MPPKMTGVLVATEFGHKGDWRMKWATYVPGHPEAHNGWLIPGASWGGAITLDAVTGTARRGVTTI
uniref:Uncharacterized protein n=2 Tax=unclassified Jerseyvirus TaxID=2025810 RepID=A0AAU8GCL9_9CAUD